MLPPICIKASSFISSLGRQVSHFGDEAIQAKGEDSALSTLLISMNSIDPFQVFLQSPFYYTNVICVYIHLQVLCKLSAD